MFEEQMSHDSRRELYEIFRLNYTKLNIILKKDGAYNGEKCPRRRANNSQQPTANKQQHGGHERPAERDANELTTDEHRDCTTNSKANSKRTQRNSRQRTSSGKQNTRCLSVRVISAWVCVGVGLVAGDGGCVLPACVRSVRFGSVFGSQRVGHWRAEHRTCVRACVWFDVKPKQAQKPQQTEAKDTRRHVCSTNQINIDLHIGNKSNLIAI